MAAWSAAAAARVFNQFILGLRFWLKCSMGDRSQKSVQNDGQKTANKIGKCKYFSHFSWCGGGEERVSLEKSGVARGLRPLCISCF
jgi:hypothetical protein